MHYSWDRLAFGAGGKWAESVFCWFHSPPRLQEPSRPDPVDRIFLIPRTTQGAAVGGRADAQKMIPLHGKELCRVCCPILIYAVFSPAATLALSFSYSLLSTRAQALYLFFRLYQGSSVARTGAPSALPSSKSSWCANS